MTEESESQVLGGNLRDWCQATALARWCLSVASAAVIKYSTESTSREKGLILQFQIMVHYFGEVNAEPKQPSYPQWRQERMNVACLVLSSLFLLLCKSGTQVFNDASHNEWVFSPQWRQLMQLFVEDRPTWSKMALTKTLFPGYSKLVSSWQLKITTIDGIT